MLWEMSSSNGTEKGKVEASGLWQTLGPWGPGVKQLSCGAPKDGAEASRLA